MQHQYIYVLYCFAIFTLIIKKLKNFSKQHILRNEAVGALPMTTASVARHTTCLFAIRTIPFPSYMLIYRCCGYSAHPIISPCKNRNSFTNCYKNNQTLCIYIYIHTHARTHTGCSTTRDLNLNGIFLNPNRVENLNTKISRLQ